MRKIAVFFSLTMIVLGSAVKGAQAQAAAQDSGEKSATSENRGQEGKAVEAYRLDFSFYELEDGKKINTRRYSLDMTTSGGAKTSRIGTKVPVATGTDSPGRSTNFQYMDVGTTIWADLSGPMRGEVRLDVNTNVSDLDMRQHDRSPATPPVVRHIEISGGTLLVTGKPILIGSMDDPNSNRQFQLEVTATKLK
jgi:hypothetical protein